MPRCSGANDTEEQSLSPSDLRADVVVVGAGAAGMYAAIEARRRGADVLLLDKSMVGRGGATILAQMTVAAAIAHAEPDDWTVHLQDTLAGGKGISAVPLAELLCREAPERIFETRAMGVKWASEGERIRQVSAPGHSRRRCCWVGVLGTGVGVSSGLQRELRRLEVRRRSGLFVTNLVSDNRGRLVGAAGFDVNSGEVVALWAPAVVLACGGLTEMFDRNSASVNMTGDAHALALRAGAELLDMEMVQFFPIAHLAPRLIGLDPIMWDPFRYRLGGRLLNGRGEEFVERYAGVSDSGRYMAPRDVLTYAILKEVETGRGTPNGGVWLDFRDIPFGLMHEAFPHAVDKLLEQGVDLRERPIEVAPMAHYMLGGVRTDAQMATRVPGLFAAGEAVGGAHGANRLSGNAITEAFAFGHRAGCSVARYVLDADRGEDRAARERMREYHQKIEGLLGRNESSRTALPALRRKLQRLMWEKAGPFRTEKGLAEASTALRELRAEGLESARVGSSRAFNMERYEWLEMENMLLAAEAIVLAARERRESRGAHQREDYPRTLAAFEKNGVVSVEDHELRHTWV